jgi:hypothetical protein
MTPIEFDRIKAMILWRAKRPKTVKNIALKNDLVGSYRLVLLRQADTFESMVVKTLITKG